MGYEGDDGYHGKVTKTELEAAVRKYAKAKIAEKELWAMLGHDAISAACEATNEDNIVAITMAGLKTSSEFSAVAHLSNYWNGEDD